MKRTFCYITALWLITPLSWATFCNTSRGSNGWIEQGMSQQQVIAACGQPDSTAEIDKTNNRLDATQYWNYQGQSVQLVPQSSWPAPTPYGAAKANNTANALVVEINNNVVSSLAVNGKLVSSGSCPNGGSVRVGDSANRVMSSCGTATQVSYQYQKNNSASPPITQWTYQLHGGRSLTIQFQQGVVSELNQ
jgi:hypothetical protein